MLRRIAVFIFILVLHSAVSAQDSYTLDQAVKYALDHNRDIVNASYDVLSAKKRVNEITGMGLPQLSGKFEYLYYAKLPTTLLPGEAFGEDAGSLIPVEFGLKHNATAGIEASQLIFDGSYIMGLQAARTYRELSRKQLQQTEIDTRYLVTKAYYNVLVNDQRLEMIGANVSRLKKMRDDTRALYQSGFAEKLDADRLEIAYNNIVIEQENTKRSLALGKQLLKFQMGLDLDIDILLSDKIDESLLNAISSDVDRGAFEKRPEYEVLRIQYELAKLDHRRNNYAYFPQLVGFGSLQTQAQRTEFDVFDNSKQWFSFGLVGATLSLNLFTGFQRSSKIQQTKITMHKVENGMQALQAGIRLEIEQAKVNYTNSLERLKIQKSNRELSEDVARVTRIKYEEGIGSNLELTDAESSLRESNSNYYNALFDAIIANLDYEKANGNLNK